MKPHLFKVLDQWLAFYRGDAAPTGFSAADTAVDAYQKLVSGNFSVTYTAPVVSLQAGADIYYLGPPGTSRRPQRDRHRSVKSACRTGGNWSSGQDRAKTDRL